MPELPDIECYIAALRRRIDGATLSRCRILTPFVLRSVSPAPDEAGGTRVVQLRRLGKRIVIGLEGDLFLVIHLMIAGRLQWKSRGAGARGRGALAAFDFDTGTLVLTEAGTRRRASLHIVRGGVALAAHDPGGIECQAVDIGSFRDRPARLSPFRMSDALDDAESQRLFAACRDVLDTWTRRLREDTGTGFPLKVTAFRKGMAVHGRYRKPCPDCGTAVQRIVHATSEINYCPGCQTGGRILADRALSRLLHDDWPAGIDDLEERGLGLRPDEPDGTAPGSRRR